MIDSRGILRPKPLVAAISFGGIGDVGESRWS